MFFNFFKRKKKEENEFHLELEDDNRLYYETIAGRNPKGSQQSGGVYPFCGLWILSHLGPLLALLLW